jgi:hypothetical protein
MQMRDAIFVILVATASLANIEAQGVHPPPVKPTDHAEVLFAAHAPDTEKADSGKPALATFEPIAFMVGNELRECYSNGSQQEQEAVGKSVTSRLNRAYAAGSHYTLWSHGAPYGRATAVSACFDDEIDFNGCFRFEGRDPSIPVPLGFGGVALSGKVPSSTHGSFFKTASKEEQAKFLQFAVKALAEHSVHVSAEQVHLKEIDVTKLQAGHKAIAGNLLVQVPAKAPKTYHSYRLFLVIEETNEAYATVLSSFHRTTVLLDDSEAPPKPGEELDEESRTDIETFFDSFPLFPGESDVVVTQHRYYEDWNFSVYRRVGAAYRAVFLGCGGGD